MIYRMIKNPYLLRFGNIACLSILFGYVASTGFYTIMELAMQGEVSYTHNVFGLSYSQTDISYALLVLFISSISLSLISHFEKPLLLLDCIQVSLYHKYMSRKVIWTIIISSVIIVICFVSGDISYMGINIRPEGNISPFGALCFIMVPPLSLISLTGIFKSPPLIGTHKKLFFMLSAILLIALIPLGRRVLMYTLLLSFILIGSNGDKRVQKEKFRIFYITAILLIISFIFVWGFRVFYTMRVVVNKMAAEQKPAVMDIIPHYIELIKDSYFQAEVHEGLIENISERPFVLSYLAGLFSAHYDYSAPLFGELGHSLRMAIPSLIYSQKSKGFINTSEDFTHPLLRIPVFDGPNTIVTAGLNDLGIIGMVLYPIGVVGLYVLLYRIISKKCPPFILAFIGVRLVYSLLYLEESLGSIVGSGLRDLFIVAALYWIVMKAPLNHFAIGRFRRSYE